MKKNLIISLKLFIFLTLILGIIYPVFITVTSNLIFPSESSGSVLVKDNKSIGSELIGQNFTDTKYFYPRPSAISYNPFPSGATNLGPTSKILKDSIEQRKKRYLEVNNLPIGTHIPEDAIFSSSSGVDPHISVENAVLQSDRIAMIRKFDESKRIKLKELINRLIERPQFGILGEERINVLKLNIELDKM